MEGQQQTPPVPDRAQIIAAPQFGSDLVSQLKGSFTLFRLTQQVNGSPDPGFQPDRRTTRSGSGDRRVDKRGIARELQRSREPEHRSRQVVTFSSLLAVRLTVKVFGQGRCGHLIRRSRIT